MTIHQQISETIATAKDDQLAEIKVSDLRALLNNRMTSDTIRLLSAKLDSSKVKQREGAFGKSLDYLETWYVIQQANEIFGYDGWSSETTDLSHLGTIKGLDKNGKDRYTVAYSSSVRVTVGNCSKEGSGFGNGLGKDELEGHELALKEAESDALKRALMKFGNQFGLALYDKTRANVEDTGKVKRDLYITVQNELNKARDSDEVDIIWVARTIDLADIKRYSVEGYTKLEERKDALKLSLDEKASAEREIRNEYLSK